MQSGIPDSFRELLLRERSNNKIAIIESFESLGCKAGVPVLFTSYSEASFDFSDRSLLLPNPIIPIRAVARA